MTQEQSKTPLKTPDELRAEIIAWMDADGADAADCAKRALILLQEAIAARQGDDDDLRDIQALTLDAEASFSTKLGEDDENVSALRVLADKLYRKIVYVAGNPKESLAQRPLSAKFLYRLDQAENGLTRDELMQKTHIMGEHVDLMLMLLTAHGVVSKENGTYRLTDEGKTLASQVSEHLNVSYLQ